MDMLRVEKRKLLVSQEASRIGHVATRGGLLTLPPKDTRQAGPLFTSQTAGEVRLFRLGKAHEQLGW